MNLGGLSGQTNGLKGRITYQCSLLPGVIHVLSQKREEVHATPVAVKPIQTVGPGQGITQIALTVF